jgi:hypothetical protein
MQPQIPPLRCGMTTKRTGKGKGKSNDNRRFPSLRYGMTNKRTGNNKDTTAVELFVKNAPEDGLYIG